MCVIRKTLFALSTASVLFVAQVNIGVASTVYKWVDEKGQVHFSQRPPEGQKSQQVHTNTPRSFGQNIEDEPAPAPATTTAESEAAPAESTENSEATGEEKAAAPAVIKKDPALCTKAQESKNMLINVPIIRRGGKVMTVEEKNQELKYVEELILVNC